MAIKLTKRNKYYLFPIVILMLILLISGVLSPVLLNRMKNDWDKISVDKIDLIENSVNQAFDIKGEQLISVSGSLNEKLKNSFRKKNDIKSLFQLFNDKNYEDFSLQLYSPKGELMLWNSDPVTGNPETLNASIGQSLFTGEKLITFLTFPDTLSTPEGNYLLAVSLPIKKHFAPNGRNERTINIEDSLSNSLGIAVKIDYSQWASSSKDGRKVSASLQNNFKNKIGIVTFDKPTLDSSQESISKGINTLQDFLVIIIFLIFSYWIKNYITLIQSRGLRLLAYTLIITLIRTLLFVFELPSSLFRNQLTNSANFSSVFAYGVVRSPLEMFITVVSLLGLAASAYFYTIDYFDSKKKMLNWNGLRFIVSSVISTVLIILTLRGFGAAVRSVIFDSTIRYFKEFALVPSPPVFLMSFNILALGLSLIIFAVVMILLVFSTVAGDSNRKKYALFIFLFFLIQGLAWIFDIVQSEPQGTPLLRIIYISLVFLFSYFLIFTGNRKRGMLVYFSFAASVISVGMLTYYNSTLEKESLRTTAHELTNSDKSLIEFMVYQTLVQSQNSPDLKKSFLEEKDLSSTAFKLWTGSLFYREGVKSAIAFYDERKKYIGGFHTGEELKFDAFDKYLDKSPDSLKVFTLVNSFADEKIFIGITPIPYDGKIIGYMCAEAVHDEDFLGYLEMPKMLISSNSGLFSVVDFEKLKIFDFHNRELLQSYGGVILSPENENAILNTDFKPGSDAWMNLQLADGNYLVYLLKSASEAGSKILAVALEERDFSWSLSDFFKVFFVHTAIIMTLLLLYILVQFRNIKLIFASYRSRLIGAFLIVSIIPLIVVAVYFRDIIESKNSELIGRRLSDLAKQVESYISSYAVSSTVNQQVVFSKAAGDLNVQFMVYSGAGRIFNSMSVLNETGIVPELLNSKVYPNCVIEKIQQIHMKENLGDRRVNSIYSLARVGGDYYVIQVNDLFNTINIPLSDLELDIFLFGIFSAALILIVIFSTVLAGQISSPIRKITSAAKSVGGGDLNVEVVYQSSGEVKDLVEGFNMMVKRIKQSQTELARLERETAWKEMAKQVAHEIKNPLTPMKLAVQQLIAAHQDRSPKFDAIFEKVSATLIAQIEILKNIASEFSGFGRMPLPNIERFNIVPAVKESVVLFENEKRDIEFSSHSAEIFVNADADNMKRTMINLIRNSIQAGAEKISVNISVADDSCMIRVADNGAGIEAENAGRIFNENYTTKHDGTGLGLSMARKFIESIGGTIVLEKYEEATIFLITLPLAK